MAKKGVAPLRELLYKSKVSPIIMFELLKAERIRFIRESSTTECGINISPVEREDSGTWR